MPVLYGMVPILVVYQIELLINGFVKVNCLEQNAATKFV